MSGTKTAWPGLLLLSILALSAPGPAAAQVSSADQICAPTTDPCVVSSATQVVSGAMLDFGDRALVITASGRLISAGGAITIFARQLQMDPSSQINLRGTTSTPGGSLDASIDQIFSLAGTVDATGNGGGSINITATRLDVDGSGRFLVNGINADSSGGDVDISADEITFGSGSTLGLTGGAQSTGGTLTMAATSMLTIGGVVDASGGDADGGLMDIEAGGLLEISSTALVRANGGLSGSGGEISISAGDSFMGSGAGDLVMSGTVASIGGGEGGDGGSIDLSAGTGCQLLGRVQAQSGGEGGGGAITITCSVNAPGNLSMGADIDARGVGTNGAGGEVTLDVGRGTIAVANKINTSGAQGGGTVSIDGANGITLAERITATGSAATGGDVTLTARGAQDAQVIVTSDGSINADGGGAEGEGGQLTIDACRMRIDSRGTAQSLTALGTNGGISLTGVREIDIAGRLSAGPTMGFIELIYRDLDPLFESTARFSPAPMLVVDTTLAGCGTPLPTRTATATIPVPTATETPIRLTPTATSTRTRTATPSGPTSTPTTRPTPAGPTDTDCNGVIDADETVGVIAAIFNPQLAVDCPNANADGNDGVTVADVLALILKTLGVN